MCHRGTPLSDEGGRMTPISRRGFVGLGASVAAGTAMTAGARPAAAATTAAAATATNTDVRHIVVLKQENRS
ncbi:hypothetical protein, partial [Streptomyces sp. NPDC127574]|uniref:hypothetical protein n=1 Tax=Streptomyces sp. NPDC127574 TaxID=3345401 RepID=UPI003627EA5A